MPSVFISYRHDDSFASAKLLVEHLRRWLPDSTFFIDESGIQAGEDWQAALAARLDGAQIVLVVIGARWLTAEQPAGGRRLDDVNDVVRWEIERALTAKKRVIPVLVDGARFCGESDLPSGLRSLARLQYCEIGRQTFDGDIQRLARTLAEESVAADPARFIWLVKRALVVVPAVSAVLLALSWSHLFDKADIWFENRITWLGDGLFDIPIRDQLKIVALRLEPPTGSSTDSSREARRLDPSRRADFAALLDELTRQGARVVVFDVTLAQESPYDDRLAESIRGAVARGVKVVFGFKAFDSATGRPRIAPAIERAGAALGVVCVGDRGGGGKNVAFGTLALIRGERAYPSLPLLAVHGSVPLAGLTATSSEVQVPGVRRPIPISLTETFDEYAPLCPARAPGTSMVRFIPHLSSRQTLRQPPVRRSFEDVVRSAGTGEQIFHDKTVLVGVEQLRDTLETPLDLATPRYGFEFQADAINALLSERVVTRVARLGQALSVVVMATLAALLRLSGPVMARRRLGWLPWSLAVLSFVVAIVVYRFRDLLWSPVFPAMACVATWAVLGFLDRRWSDGKS
jgi:hypothetical protein